MLSSLLTSGFLLVSQANFSEAQTTIPTQFQGEWNSRLQNCGSFGGEDRLLVQAQELWFYESGGPVRAIVTMGMTDLAVILELSGEGETWLEYRYFRLNQDHSQLTEITPPATRFTRLRCPP